MRRRKSESDADLRRLERELDEELSFHRKETVEALLAGGLTREEAEMEAGRRFGDPGYRDRLVAIDRAAARQRRLHERLLVVTDSFRFAARSVVRTPGLSLGVVLAFALGIGANAVMYGTLDRLLLRPPDQIHDAERVQRLWIDRLNTLTKVREPYRSFTYPDYVELGRVTGFSGIAAYSARSFTVGHGAEARVVKAQLVTGAYWRVLGVRAALGRFFDESDDVRNAAGVAVISHGMWQREYGGQSSALGRTIDFGRGPYTIVGVAPRGFTGPELLPVDFWVPLHVAAYQTQGDYWARSRSWWWLTVVARLADGVSAERAAGEATAAYRISRREQIERGSEAPDPDIVPASLIAARGPRPGAEVSVARWLAGVSLVVLLIACANVANLLLARAIRQQRETGIRLALGISRGRLALQTLAQGLVLALAGSVAALLVAFQAGSWMQRTLLPDVAWGSPVSGRVLVFVLITALAAGVLSALLLALQTARRDVADVLRVASGGIAVSSARLRATLSGLQAALSVVLLVGAGLFIRSLQRVHAIDPGFDAAHLLYMQPAFAPGAMPEHERPLLFEEVSQRVARLPGVRGVAAAELVPFMGSMSVNLRAEGVDSVRPTAGGGPMIDKVSADYFDVMGLRILRGRAFQHSDRKGTARVVVISESMARHVWPDREAVGRCLYIETDPACVRVVGVVEDARRSNVTRPAEPIYYLLMAQELAPTVTGTWTLIVRSTGDPQVLVEPVRRTVFDTDARVRQAETRTFQELIDPQLRAWTLGATLFAAFGILALVVAAIGLYSVLSFDVAQRTREIGLRSALGASRAAVVRLFVVRALVVTAAGTAAGMATAVALAPRLESLLFETPALDALTFAVAVLTLAAVAVAASSLPALRAARIDPNRALRMD